MPTARRTSTRREVPPVTKRLVAHVPPDHWSRAVDYGPRDGVPVGVPAPCSRLLAGYWCSCGAGFAELYGFETCSRARVEAVDDDPDGALYVPSSDGCAEPRVPWPTTEQRHALQQSVEDLPVGCVVERRGTGIGIRFSEPEPRPLDDGLPW